MKLLNNDENFENSEYQIVISPNLGDLKSTVKTDNNGLNNSQYPSEENNIKDELISKIRIFLKKCQKSSPFAFNGYPLRLKEHTTESKLLKKRELNDFNKRFKNQMKANGQIIQHDSEENLLKLENSAINIRKDSKTNGLNKRIIPSNQTSPNLFSKTAMLTSCQIGHKTLDNIILNESFTENACTKLKSRINIIKTYQKINENEMLLNNIREIEGFSLEIQNHIYNDNSGKIRKILNLMIFFILKDLTKRILISIEKIRKSLIGFTSSDNAAFRTESKESWIIKINKLNCYLNLIEVFYPLITLFKKRFSAFFLQFFLGVFEFFSKTQQHNSSY